MPEIDEFKPIKDSEDSVKHIFKQVLVLEKDNLYHQNPKLDEEVIKIVQNIIK
tara:strand:+ start:438 stop:596 length:159 start_codon:yes stop_codon:yes gene_type:complete